ncbi:MAG: hypothetical protein ABI852_17755 [Gemmatimonadaceae bacterium]
MIRQHMNRQFARCALLLSVVALSSVPAAAQRLFRTTAPLEVTFTTDLRTLVKDRDSTKLKPHGALMTYKEADGKVVSIPVTLQTRGHFRRQDKNCSFPPLLMQFKKKDADNTLLQGNTKLKITVNCRPKDDTYEQYVLQEYALYRVYQRVSPLYFRTRLAKAVFKDSLAKTGDVESWAFFIEDEKEIAKEFKTASEKSKGALFDQLEPTQLAITTLFEYMVANTDYSISQQHNMALLRDTLGTVIRTVAYDFDWSGAINTRYAFPDARLGIKLTTDRLFRGPCLTPAQWAPHIAHFVAARPAIDSIYNSIPSLDPKKVKASLEWFNESYKTVTDPRSLKHALIDPCQRDGN